MGKIVPLPNSGSRHMSLGVSALQKQNYASAVAHLEKAYKETPVFEVARPLVKALVGLHQSSEALPYVSEYMEDFLASDSTTKLLFEVLLDLPDYRFAWAVLHHVESSKAAAFEQQITAAETADLTAHGDEIADLARRLRHLGGLSPHEQEQLIQQLGRLPKAKIIEAAKPNLVDPDVHPAIRVSLLDALTAVGEATPVEVTSYQTTAEVIPSALPGVMNDPTMLQVLNQIQLQVGLADPELMKATVETLRFELGYLYPFIGEAVPDPKHFAASYLNRDRPEVTAGEHALFDWLGTQTQALTALS